MPSARYEYAVLVTSTQYEILPLARLYRDRADAENNFDELKNQWRWGSFTTQDLARCRMSHGVATQTKHAGQTRLTITSTPAKVAAIQAVLTSLAGFLRSLKATAEQLTDAQRLRAILTRAFAKFMLATVEPPSRLTA